MSVIEWVITAVAGPVLVLALTVSGRSILNTRTNAVRLDNVEADMGKLEETPERLAALEEKLAASDRATREADRRNDDDHKRISQEIKDLKDDLIQEFRAANGK